MAISVIHPRHRLALATMFMVIALAVSDLAAGGPERAGTAAAPELLIPVGARDMALGGATVASSAGIGALHWNPAGLARGRDEAQLLFSTMSYVADIRVNYVAVSGHFGQLGSLALSVKALDFGDIPITTASQPDGTGATYSPTFLTTGVTWARPLSDRITQGGTMHYVSALLRAGSLDDLRRSTSVYKIQTSSADLPSTFEIGLGYTHTPAPLGKATHFALFQHHNFAHDQWKLGSEYVYRDFFAARGGIDYADDGATNAHIFGTSFGFGLQLDLGGLEDVQLDYAYTTVDYFDPLSTFTFRVGF